MSVIIDYIPVETEQDGLLRILAVRLGESFLEIPIDENNEDYQTYLKWKEERDLDGNN